MGKYTLRHREDMPANKRAEFDRQISANIKRASSLIEHALIETYGDVPAMMDIIQTVAQRVRDSYCLADFLALDKAIKDIIAMCQKYSEESGLPPAQWTVH